MKTSINFPLISALILAAIGAATSLIGLVAMFSVAFLPLGAALECGKIASAAALHRRWTQLSRFVCYALTAIVILLMVLTSSGIFAFTLNRYLDHIASIEAPVAERIAAAGEAIQQQAEKLADLDKQIAQVDAEPALEITSSARPRTAAQIAAQAKAQAEANKLRIADQQRRQAKRDALSAKRNVEAGELAKLRSVRAEVGSQAQAAEAEVGPVKLIADALGVDAGKVVATAVAMSYVPFAFFSSWLLHTSRQRQPPLRLPSRQQRPASRSRAAGSAQESVPGPHAAVRRWSRPPVSRSSG